MELLSVLDAQDNSLVPEIVPEAKRVEFWGSGADLLEFFGHLKNICKEDSAQELSRYALLSVFSMEDFHQATISARTESIATTIQTGSVNVVAGGEVTVPVEKFIEILKVTKDAQRVNVSVVSDTAVITAGRALWRITLPATDLDPSILAIHAPTESALTVIPRETLLDALKGAQKACVRTVSRVALNQVLVRKGAIVGTDGSRLHHITVPELDVTAPDATIPLDVVSEMIRTLIASDDEDVAVALTPKEIYLRVSDRVLSAQPLLTPFPNIDSLILSTKVANVETVLVEKEDLERGVASVRVTANQDYASINMSMVPRTTTKTAEQEWNLVLESKVLRGHQGSFSMDAQYFEGNKKGRTLTFNYQHLLGVLSILPPKSLVRIHLGVDTRSMKTPILIESENLLAVFPQMKMHF